MIKFIATGGTIDKIYNPLNGELIFLQTQINKILITANIKENIVIKELFLKDSLFLDNNDRQNIANECKNSCEDKIVITHGTDTLVESAKYIQKENLQKTIILTGAMVPYSISGSDATFNVAFALACAKILDYGVYITFNGNVFKAGEVKKNKIEGFFEKI